MKIGVVGGGVVGHATARCFIEHVDQVCVYDVMKERCTHPLGEVLSCDLVFICLPTPMKEDDKCDLSYVEKFFHDMKGPDHDYRRINIVLRSTVPVGTTKRLSELLGLRNLVHSPEFLTARCAVTDAQLPARNVIGSPVLPDNSDCVAILYDLYSRRFPGVPVHVLNSNESEAVKLFQNSFFAVKVSFWNECYAYAKKVGLNWDQVLAAVLADGRISHSHTRVPGPDGKTGFGGNCLIKDLNNLIECIESVGLYAHVTSAADERNRMLDREEEV